MNLKRSSFNSVAQLTKFFCLFCAFAVGVSANWAVAGFAAGQNQAGKVTISAPVKERVFEFNNNDNVAALASLNTNISLKVNEASVEMIAKDLSQQCGEEINVTLVKPPATNAISIDIANVPLKDILRFFNDNGYDVRVAGYSFSQMEEARKVLSTALDKGISISVSDVPLKNLVNMLGYLSGQKVALESGDGDKRVTISVEKIKFHDLLRKISSETDSKINFIEAK